MQMDYTKQHALGHRAYFLFLAKRIKFSIFLFALTWVAWNYPPPAPPQSESAIWITFGIQMLLLVSIGFFALVVIRTFLEYRRYTYRFTEEGFLVTHGYFIRNEMAAVYHQIQAVNIKRTPLDRLIGVSQLIIFLAGPEQESHHTKILLPGVGRTRARLIQQELLARARRHAFPLAEYPVSRVS